jgi:hypothetical protein
MVLIEIPKEKVKVANRKMIAQCCICWQRIKPQEEYLDQDYFGWNTTAHVKCWLEYPRMREHHD